METQSVNHLNIPGVMITLSNWDTEGKDLDELLVVLFRLSASGLGDRKVKFQLEIT